MAENQKATNRPEEIRNSQSEIRNPLVAVIMGSQSDWETMRHADETLTQFGVEHECRVISAHRSPSLAAEFGSTAETRGLEVVIAAAGGAALFAVAILANSRPELRKKLHEFREVQEKKIRETTL